VAGCGAGGPHGGNCCASSAERATNLRKPQDGVTKLAPDQAEDQTAGIGGMDEVRTLERENVHREPVWRCGGHERAEGG